MKSQLWWYVARSSGLVAWGLLSLSVVWGLLMSTRLLGRRPGNAWLLAVHRGLGGLAVIFTGLHLTGIVADSYSHFGLADILVPLTSRWKPVAVAWGIVGLYLLAAVEITSLLRPRLPRRFWHRIHQASFGLFLLATVHGFTAGTDGHEMVAIFAGIVAVTVVSGLAYVRFADVQEAPRPPVPTTVS
jgi:DMSO/TMAO reductase YedYZ heme-binding membrane subunit